MSVNSHTGDQYYGLNQNYTNVWEPPCFKRKCAICSYKLECANYQPENEPVKWTCNSTPWG